MFHFDSLYKKMSKVSLVSFMLRIAIILSLLLQPLVLLQGDCAAAVAAPLSAHAPTCCDPPPTCCGSTVAAPPCCTGATVCACGEREDTPPAPAPSRGGVDHLLLLLHLPTGPATDLDRPLPRRGRSAGADLVLAAVSAPHAFYCVWLT